MSQCPCGTGQNYSDCCEPIIKGTKNPATAEVTMRARYSAFAKSQVDFIESSHDPNERGDFDRKSVQSWADNSEWLGLEIVETHQGKEGDKTGVVEFIAKFKTKGEEQEHHEVADFVKKDDFWYFVDGKIQGAQIVRSAPKIGRNDPCHCGSGKKFKKCHGT